MASSDAAEIAIISVCSSDATVSKALGVRDIKIDAIEKGSDPISEKCDTAKRQRPVVGLCQSAYRYEPDKSRLLGFPNPQIARLSVVRQFPGFLEIVRTISVSVP